MALRRCLPRKYVRFYRALRRRVHRQIAVQYDDGVLTIWAVRL